MPSWEDDFPLPRVGYVGSQEGNHLRTRWNISNFDELWILFLLVMVAIPFSQYCRMLVNCQPYHPNLQTYSSWAVEIGHNGLAKGGVFEKRRHFWGRTEAPPDRRHGTLQPLDLSKLREIETS